MLQLLATDALDLVGRRPFAGHNPMLLGVVVVAAAFRTTEEIENAFAAFGRDRTGVIVIRIRPQPCKVDSLPRRPADIECRPCIPIVTSSMLAVSCRMALIEPISIDVPRPMLTVFSRGRQASRFTGAEPEVID